MLSVVDRNVTVVMGVGVGVSVGAAVGGKMCSKAHSLDKKCPFTF